MRCPVCERGPMLLAHRPQGGPTMYRCPACDGRWLRSTDYWRWRSTPRLPVPLEAAPPAAHRETAGVKLCPEDAYVLSRFRVGRGSPFTIDQCRMCAGIWMDAGEWELIRRMGVERDLHDVPKDEWQRRLREAEGGGGPEPGGEPPPRDPGLLRERFSKRALRRIRAVIRFVDEGSRPHPALRIPEPGTAEALPVCRHGSPRATERGQGGTTRHSLGYAKES